VIVFVWKRNRFVATVLRCEMCFGVLVALHICNDTLNLCPLYISFAQADIKIQSSFADSFRSDNIIAIHYETDTGPRFKKKWWCKATRATVMWTPVPTSWPRLKSGHGSVEQSRMEFASLNENDRFGSNSLNLI
jgi:hypothetical protein